VGSDNLFAFNLRDLSARLRTRPSIESVSVVRVLPDTLVVRIMEREPRALINSAQSPYVVDVNGTLMLRTECMDISSSLPVISGIRDLAMLKTGMKVTEAAAPMEMLRIIKTSWPDIRVLKVVVRPKNMICSVKYKSFPEPFRVELPKKNIPGKVRELATALDRIVNTASTKRNINLMYENRAVLTDLPGSAARTKKKR
ncbi:MAG: FtsQ-type POTRA domain-containing protein, partial [Lentisphaeria bacterium]|nr:FtsQ-type POTRA domain-containing protein [Lentisphaeria bacterium]